MTKEEAAVLVHEAPVGVRMEFRPEGTSNFVALKAGPCPLYIFGACTVYAHRPYNCRRYICLRPDVRAEPFDPTGANLMDRVKTNRKARRMAEQAQRKARRWADQHGWAHAARSE